MFPQRALEARKDKGFILNCIVKIASYRLWLLLDQLKRNDISFFILAFIIFISVLFKYACISPPALFLKDYYWIRKLLV